MNLNTNIRGLSLPFFSVAGQQNYLKRWCYKNTLTFKLITTQYKLPPFQIRRRSTVDAITSFYLENIDSGLTYNLITFVTNNLTYERSVDFGWVIYQNIDFFESLIPCGQYIIKISDGVEAWESEVITIQKFVDIADSGSFGGIDDLGSKLLISDDDFLMFNINEFVQV